MNTVQNPITTESTRTSPSFAWMSAEWIKFGHVSYYAQIVGENGKENFVQAQGGMFRQIEDGLWYSKDERIIKECSRPSIETINECYESGHVFEEDGYILFCI